MQINVYEAKTQLSSLLDRAVSGETIVIARAGEPLVRLGPIQQPTVTKSGVIFRGLLAGKIKLEEGYFEPVSDEELLGDGP